jgi:type II secretion system protein C
VLPYVFRALQVSFIGGAGLLLWNSVFALASGAAAATSLGTLDVPVEAPRAERSIAEYQVIDGRNLFKASKAPKPAPTEAPVAPSRLQLQLLGTVAGDSPERSVGVVRDMAAGNKVDVVGVGDPVAAGQARVVRIEQRRMVISHNGQLEAVEVQPKAAVGIARGKRPNERAAAQGQQRMAESMRRFNEANNMATPPQAPATVDARPDGYFAGIQVQQSSTLSQFGIEAGDRLMTLDGVPLNDPSVIAGVMQAMGRGQPKSLGVERNGSNVQVEIPAEKLLEVLRSLRLTQ